MTVGCDLIVQLPDGTTAQVSRIFVLCIHIFNLFIDSFKIRIGDNRFSSEYQFSLKRNLQRNVFKDSGIVCHHLADRPISSGNRFFQTSVPVRQNNRQSVHLPGKKSFLFPQPVGQGLEVTLLLVVLVVDDHKQGVAVNKRIYRSVHGCCNGRILVETGVRIKVPRKVTVRAGVVIALRHYQRVVHPDVLHRAEPLLIFPLRVVGARSLHQITVDQHELCLRYQLLSGVRRFLRHVEHFVILCLRVGHIDKGIPLFSAVRIGSSGKMADFAPSLLRAYAEGIGGTGLQRGGQGLVAGVRALGVGLNTVHVILGRHVVQVLHVGRSGVKNQVGIGKILGRGVGLGHNLHLSALHLRVRKPGKAHLRAGVAVDGHVDAVRLRGILHLSHQAGQARP